MLSLLVVFLLLHQPPAPKPAPVAPAPAAPTPPVAPATPPPATDIYKSDVQATINKVREAKPQPIAPELGKDNQPFFTPDGHASWFTANREGNQTYILEFNRKPRRVRRRAARPEEEYSAALTPD